MSLEKSTDELKFEKKMMCDTFVNGRCETYLDLYVTIRMQEYCNTFVLLLSQTFISLNDFK